MRVINVVAFALVSGSLLFAQFGAGGPGPGGPGGGGPGGGGPGRMGLHGMHAGKLVTGAPYSATVTNTSVKVLADGNTIQRTTSGVVARDSQGRTYSQETVSGLFGQTGTKTMTFIADPVAGYVYTLNADTKTAMRRALHQPQPGDATGPGSRQHNGLNGTASANLVTSDLGTQTVNGISVQGKSVTHTIPAGQVGNEKPIVSTTESWYSPDLQVVISSKRSDPSQGTSTYALTNIQRTEPNSSLFAVPADYTIKDAPSFGPHP